MKTIRIEFIDSTADVVMITRTSTNRTAGTISSVDHQWCSVVPSAANIYSRPTAYDV